MRYAVEVPGYEILAVLGHGGQARVYYARQGSVAGREVAVKVYDRSLVTERDRRRFEREVHAVSSLSGHRHVIQVYDAGLLPTGQPYLAMEHCPGGSLAARLRERGPVPPDETRAIGTKIAGALATAHHAGVLHRDVKPGNVLVTRDGEPVLTDFGIAALLRPGVEQSATLGLLTPAYAAPEMFHGGESTAAGDIYSLGATLYALLVGRPARWPAGREPSLAEMFLLYEHPLPDVPGAPAALLAVLRRAMASDPAQRYPSAADLAHALTGLPAAVAGTDRTGSGRPAGGHPAPARDAGAPPPGPPPAPAPGPGGVETSRPDGRRPAPATLPAPAWWERIRPGRRVSVVPTARELSADVALALALVATLGAWAASVRGWPAGLALPAAALGMLALAGWGRFLPTVAAYAVTTGVGFWANGGVVWREGSHPAVWWRPVAWLATALVLGFTAVLGYDLRGRWRRRTRARALPRWSGRPSDRPPLPALAHIPAARFFRLPFPHCEVAVAAGDRVALVHWTTWPGGRYTVTGDRVQADGHAWDQGNRELVELRAQLADLRAGLAEHPAPAGSATVRAFLLVAAPAVAGGGGPHRPERPVVVTGTPDPDVMVLAEEHAEPALGEFLSERPYRLVAPVVDHLARITRAAPAVAATGWADSRRAPG